MFIDVVVIIITFLFACLFVSVLSVVIGLLFVTYVGEYKYIQV